MKLEEQLREWWRRRRKKDLSSEGFQQIQGWVEAACQKLADYGSLEDCLERSGIHWQISQSPHVVAGVRMRAQLDLNSRRLTIYAGALDELQTEHRPRKILERVILSHEVFHLLCPQCPAPYQEASAHWFAAVVTDLAEFPGSWDLNLE